MLTISRKEGEGFTLVLADGGTVKIKLAYYDGQQTKVSISAPQNVLILRDELVDTNELTNNIRHERLA